MRNRAYTEVALRETTKVEKSYMQISIQGDNRLVQWSEYTDGRHKCRVDTSTVGDGPQSRTGAGVCCGKEQRRVSVE